MKKLEKVGEGCVRCEETDGEDGNAVLFCGSVPEPPAYFALIPNHIWRTKTDSKALQF